MKDIIYYRKSIENIIENARRDGFKIELERNDLNDMCIMIVDPTSKNKIRVRKLNLQL